MCLTTTTNYKLNTVAISIWDVPLFVFQSSRKDNDVLTVINVVTSISTFILMYGLFLFFKMSSEYLKNFKIRPKFKSIILVLISDTMLRLLFNLLIYVKAIGCTFPWNPQARAMSMIYSFLFNFTLPHIPYGLMG